jgi:hypothetical protein
MGSLIVARTLDATSVDSGLLPGDAVVPEIERSGRFQYLHFEME